MKQTDAPRHRWFRYSLRTFFVVLTILGVWLGVQVKWIKDRDAALNDLSKVGYDLVAKTDAPWSIRILGADGFLCVYVFRTPSADRREIDQIIDRIRPLFPEATVEIRDVSEDWDRRY